MKIRNLRNGSWAIRPHHLALLLTAGLTAACGTSDEAAAGPAGYGDVANDTGSGDIAADAGADTAAQPQVDFYLELKSGDALKNANSVILATTQDKYADDPGFQTDVIITATNVPDGTEVTLTIGGASLGKATINSGAATLSKITIQCASVAQDIVVAAAGASKTKSALVNCTNACTATLAATAACTTADADPGKDGFQVALEVSTTTPDCSHAYIKYTDAEGKAGESDKVALNGLSSVTVVVTVSSKSTGLANATAQVEAVVEDQAYPTRPVGSSAQQTVQVTTESPVVTILQPTSDQITLADDANGNPADGIQVNIVGTATTMKPLEAIEITVNGLAVGKTNIGANGSSFQTTLTLDKSQAYKVAVAATNSCGLAGATEKTLTAFVDLATLVISSPAPNDVLLAKDDDDPKTTTIYETEMIVDVAKANAGDKVSIFCRANAIDSAYGTTAHGTAVFPAGASGVAIQVALNINDLTAGVVCRASIDGANPATSPESSFTIALPAPCLVISQPSNNAVTNLATLPISATATGLDGRIIEAKLSLKGGATFIDAPVGKVANNSVGFNLALQAGNPAKKLPDGTYVLRLSTTDALGNDAKDSACSDLTRTIVLDSTAPALVITAPTKASLDPIVDPDGDATTPGYQTDVTVAVSGETGESTVCLKINAFGPPCQKIKGAGTVTFADVTLQAGQNSLVVSGTDKQGNTKTNPAKTITLISNAVIVTWVSPKTNAAVATDSITVQAKITSQKDGAPIAGAKVVVHVDGPVQVGIKVAESPGGIYTATVPGLNVGANELQLVATPAGGGAQGVSPVLVITRKDGLPTVTVTSPADKTSFNGQSTACVPGVTDCSTSVVASVGNAINGSSVTALVTCGASSKTYSGTVAGGKATIAGVQFVHGGSCSVVATVTDEAGQKADSAAVTVTVDRVAPKLIELSPSKASFLAADDLNKNPADGLQLLLTVNVSGLEENGAVALDIFDDDGKKVQSYTSQDHPAVGETSKLKVGFGAVTLPDGLKVKLVLTASDAAGNVASLQVTVKVVVNAPDVRIGQPTYVNATNCTTSASCGAGVCVGGKCATPFSKLSAKQVSIVTIGLLPGAVARVCSKSSSVTGNGACARPGYNAVGPNIPITVNGGILVANLPDGQHTVSVEVLPVGKNAAIAGDWVSSVSTPLGDTLRRRYIYVDTVSPALKSVLAPTISGVPAGCLAAASQTKLDDLPGGTFSFAATMDNEDATISVFSAGSKVGTAASTGKIAGVSVTLPTGSATLQAVATDIVGNESAAFTVGTYTVDTIAPLGQFVLPPKIVIVKGDTLDLTVSSPSADVEGQPVVLKDAGKTVGTLSMTKGFAIFAHATYGTLSDGSHTVTALLKDTCGNTATIATVPSTLLVDTTAPTVSIAAPTDKQVFGDADDADAITSGYQIKTTFGSSGGDTWKVELGTDCDATFANCGGFNTVSAGTVTKDGGTEPDVSVTVSFGKTDNYVVRVSVTDEHGNTTSADRPFKVTLTGCKVVLAGLPSTGQVNTQSCPTKGTDCASVNLALKAEYVGPCGNITEVRFMKGSVVAGKVTPSNSAASFTLGVKDGDDMKVEAIVFAGTTNVGTSGAAALQVDLTNPKVSFVAGKIAGFDTAASGTSPVYGASRDQDPSQNGIQIHALIEVADANLSGATLTSLKNVQGTAVDLASAVKFPLNLTGSGGTATAQVKLISLAADATSKIQASATDGAGNVGSATLTVVTDSTPPAALVLDAIDETKVNPRRPSALLTFKAPGDNGATGIAAAKYEVRYSKADITNLAEFEKACNTTALSTTKLTAPKAPGSAETLVIEGPDGRDLTDACKFAPHTDNGKSSWYFAARALDAAGNAGSISNAVSTKELRLKFAKVTGSVSPYDSKFLYALPLAIGDVNGDGMADFGVRSIANMPFCVVYGVANTGGVFPDIDLKAKSASTHDCWIEPMTLGQEVAANIDVNGDGVQDLVASYGEGAGVPREIRVYLGEKGKPLTSIAAVTLKNVSNAAAAGVAYLASAGNFTGDLASGSQPIDDFVFRVTPTTAEPYDKVMVMPGNKAWSTSSPITVDVTSAADRKTHNMLTIYRSDSSGSPIFGFSLGGGANIIADGDGTGTQYDDLVITQFNSPQTVFIVKGRPVSGDQTLTLTSTLSGAGTGDTTTVALRLDGETGSKAPQDPVIVSFDGDGIPDLMFAHAPGNAAIWLYWVRGKSITASLGKVTVLQSSVVSGVSGLRKHTMGYAVSTYAYPLRSAGNFLDQSGTGAIAIAYSQASYGPTGRTRVSIRAPLLRASGTGTEPSYHVEDLSIEHPFAAGSKDFGSFNFRSIGDVNGDGHPDLLVGTYSGYAVLIY